MCSSICYGVNVPNFGDYHNPRVLVELATSAEEAGWDGFFIWDHLEGEASFCDPTVALSAIALQTSHIRLGAMITPLPRRRPWKVAREMVSLDHLSGGRLIMGVGLGNPPTEYSKFGEEQDTRIRAKKLDESLDIIKGLWSGKSFSYDGKHYQLEDVTFNPKSVQEPRIPIWVGGFWPNRAPFQRAARYDGVYPAANWPDTLTPTHLRTIQEYIGRYRRTESPFDVVVGGSTPSDREKGAEIVDPWIRAGATWWSEDINGWRGSLDEMKERIKQGPPRT
jgi:alkanesulfonate monooxygenase SsuD/methylene tetrahydromethanopterin reductase-like flavin-dependent oxidoreductase (luciferase family)